MCPVLRGMGEKIQSLHLRNSQSGRRDKRVTRRNVEIVVSILEGCFADRGKRR